jgi:hypothetical protein
MRGLRAQLSALTGPGGAVLPDRAAEVRYGRFDPPRLARWGGSTDLSSVQWGPLPRMRDDALLASAPDEVPLSVKEMPYQIPTEDRVADGLPAKPVDGALQPVWVVAEIPADAPPGDYRGTLSIRVEGEPPVNPVAGDADANGIINVSDVVFLIQFVFGAGAAPQGCAD